MRVVNATKDSTIADSLLKCRTFWEQTRGMMFREEVIPLLFVFPKPQRVHLHSWFCPGAMDLILLNDAWEVVELKSEWERRSSYSSERDCSFLLELPVGTIAQTRTQVGDVLHFFKKEEKNERFGKQGAQGVVQGDKFGSKRVEPSKPVVWPVRGDGFGRERLSGRPPSVGERQAPRRL